MDITVTATTPPGTTFDSASGSPTTDPGVGGSGTVTWSYPELPMGGSSIVTMTVRVDAGLANGTPITITGYQVECSMPPGILPELGVDLTVTVQSIRPIIVTKKDYPDPVLTDDLLYYTATVTNLGPQSLTNVLLQEVYDPNLAFVSAIPPPDSGTVDRWTIPFLPFGGSREFVIQMKVRDATEPGSIQHNKVTAETAFGNVSNMFEDTVVTNEDELMTATLDDFPDPAEPDQAVQYDFAFGNGTERDLNNVIVRAWYSPELKFISADRPPDIIAPIAEWNIGTMLAGSSDQIFLTLAPVALFPKGTTAQVRFWVTDDSGATASANESTVFAEPSGPYVITIIGKPKNPSVSVDALEIYSIEIRNITPNPQNVTVTDFLPSSLKFIGASPPAILSPPGATSGGTVTWTIPNLRPGATVPIELRTSILPDSIPGTTLENTVNVSDQSGNVAEKTYIGHLRGRPVNAGPQLTATMTVSRTTLPGAQLRYTLKVKNSGAGTAKNVMVTQSIPRCARFPPRRPARRLAVS
jgi:uncharacterized repeat protein (TIGR01451 family)